MDEGTIKTSNPKMLSLLVFKRVYRIEIEMFVFSTRLVYCCPSTISLTSPLPPPYSAGV
jgi:hypothetical protein